MVYKVILSPEVRDDLKGIYDYISSRFFMPQIATKTIENIQNTIKQIQAFPHIGMDVSNRINSNFFNHKPLRMMISGHYLIFYVINYDDIWILRVLYQSRDWVSVFS